MNQCICNHDMYEMQAKLAEYWDFIVVFGICLEIYDALEIDIQSSHYDTSNLSRATPGK